MNKAKDINVVIDGIPVANLMYGNFERNAYDIEPFISEITYSRFEPSVMRIELRTKDNIELSFDITNGEMLQNEEGIFISGPLRKLFPSLFIDKDLLPWQLAYLEAFNQNKAARFIMFRDDEYFKTAFAQTYEVGYTEGNRIGELKGKELGLRIGRQQVYEELEKQQQQQRKNKSRR